MLRLASVVRLCCGEVVVLGLRGAGFVWGVSVSGDVSHVPEVGVGSSGLEWIGWSGGWGGKVGEVCGEV